MYFMEYFTKAHANAIRHGLSLTLVMVDLDDFKAINDNYGHQVGDNVLIAASQLLQSGCREEDLTEQENSRGKILIACPGEELHELGIRMLADIWELEGWDVTYLGSNIPAQFITDKLMEENYDVLALSNSISFNLKFSKETIEKAIAAGYTGLTLVGGRAFNVVQSLKDYDGVDYHGSDFYQAVQILEEIEQNKTNR